MKQFLMGAEVEYSMAGQHQDRRMQGETIHAYVLRALREKYRWVPDLCSERGMFLENSMRYYLDSGAHNELCSPEVFTPRQIATYDKAGERMLYEATCDAMRKLTSASFTITKYNIDFHDPDHVAWGQHESYTSWQPLEKAASQLIAHVVTRLPYAGAGFLSEYERGWGFELSQRARHLVCDVGSETTRNRAIFCVRLRKDSDFSTSGWQRAHLIAKDSQRSPFGTYLTFGVTGLLFLLVNDGHRIGQQLQLAHPVNAIRKISADPWLKARVEMQDGRSLTAVEIQRLYLEAAEPLVTKGDYPDWTREVLEHWSETLDALEQNPLRLASRLDAYMKLMIFDTQLVKADTTWPQLRDALRLLQRIRRTYPKPVVAMVIQGKKTAATAEANKMRKALEKLIRQAAVSLEQLRLAMRLQALELNFHQLGGFHDDLYAQGKVEPVVVDEQGIQDAMVNPPRGGRAEVRANFIKKLSGTDTWRCDWNLIYREQSTEVIDLRDPFCTREKTVSVAEFEPESRYLRRLRGGEVW